MLQVYFYEKEDWRGKIGNQKYDGASKRLKSVLVLINSIECMLAWCGILNEVFM